MKVIELIETLRKIPYDYQVGVGGEERGSSSAKYVHVDTDNKTVTIWNVTKEEVEEEYGQQEHKTP